MLEYDKLLFERTQKYMDYAYEHESRFAQMIYDEEGRKVDAEKSRNITRFLFANPASAGYDRIVPNPVFGNSETIPGLQLADYVARAVRLYYEFDLDRATPTGLLQEALSRYYIMLEAKTYNQRPRSSVSTPTTYGLYDGRARGGKMWQ